MTSPAPLDPDDAPVEASLVMAVVLLGFGLPMTAAAAAFAFGSLEDIGKGVVVAVVVWAAGIGLAQVRPLRTGPAAPEDVHPLWRWGVPAAAIAAMVVVVGTGAPFLPWLLVLVVGSVFAWTAGSLWAMARQRRLADAPDDAG